MVVIVDDDVALCSGALLRVLARGGTEWWNLIGVVARVSWDMSRCKLLVNE